MITLVGKLKTGRAFTRLKHDYFPRWAVYSFAHSGESDFARNSTVEPGYPKRNGIRLLESAVLLPHIVSNGAALHSFAHVISDTQITFILYLA